LREARGFTLIELMMVCAVIAIVLAIALPGLSAYRRTMALQQARAQVIADVRTAREAAVTRHRGVIVTFGDGVATSNLTTYSILTDLNNNGVVDPGEPFNTRSLPNGVTMSSSLDPADRLNFDTGGLLVAGTSGGRLILRASRGRPDTLNVSAVGMIYRP